MNNDSRDKNIGITIDFRIIYLYPISQSTYRGRHYVDFENHELLPVFILDREPSEERVDF